MEPTNALGTLIADATFFMLLILLNCISICVVVAFRICVGCWLDSEAALMQLMLVHAL